MYIIERDQPGHFCCADRCEYFKHTDISRTENAADTVFCVSSVGLILATGPKSEFLDVIINGRRYEKINIASVLEVHVFDLESENRWAEIEGFRSNDVDEIKRKHSEFVNKYLQNAIDRYS